MTSGSQTKHLVIGTAGHVDHGKTTLIKAMTGINTDRLKEEQERGLTIDLGFASLRLPSGRLVGIVDVPGHERFLKNMLAGASGVDIALLVVAADEGVMPQTREHLDILELLETPLGIIALTKCDMVDSEWLDVVEEDLRDSLQHTFLKDAAIIRVSGATGSGVRELVDAIDRLADQAEQRSVEGPFRLPVDRVFTITGFGTVVTGTLVSGTLKVGDPVMVLPQKIETRVRQLQVHAQKQETVYAGTRVAVNLAGVDKDDLQRGSVLLPPGYLQPTSTLDAVVTVLKNSPRPLSNRTRIRLHIGTAEALGRAAVLGAEQIEPGKRGFVQLRLEEPVVAAREDRFVLRFYSPTDVLGGGTILDPTAIKHKRSDLAVIDRLERKLKGDPVDMAADVLGLKDVGLTRDELAKAIGLGAQETEAALRELMDGGRVLQVGNRLFDRARYEQLAQRLLSSVGAYHKSYPMRPGMPKEELRAQLGPGMDQRTFQAILAGESAAGKLAVMEAAVKLPDHQPTLNPAQERLAKKIEESYRRAGVNPPLASEVQQRFGQDAKEITALLVERGVLVRIGGDLLFSEEAICTAEKALREFLQQNGQITVSQFRDLIGSSRKYTVPLLEYFDDIKITRRSGDLRVPYR